MTITSDFFKRKAVSATVKVPVPESEPQLILEIARFAKAEESKVLNEAVAISSIHTSEEVRSVSFQLEFIRQYFLILQRHVKGWEKKSDNVPDYSQEALKRFWENSDTTIQQTIVNGYMKACREDEEAHEKNAQSRTASGKQLESALS
jgi:hypothetical protein